MRYTDPDPAPTTTAAADPPTSPVVPDVELDIRVRAPGSRQISDVLEVRVPKGHRVFCVSDLHLRPKRSEASAWAIPELAKALDALDGPATLVLIGDVLEMWFVQPPDGLGSLDAHPDLTEAVERFRAGHPQRRVLYAIGNHDGRLGWDGDLLDAISERLGCEFAFAIELIPDEGDGGRVRIEHGHAYDPANAFEDPRDPGESPLGMHLVEEVMPELTFAEHGALDGFDRLANPRTFLGFMSSRYFYRRVVGIAGWIVIPLALLFLARIVTGLLIVLSGDPRSGLDDALRARFIGLDTVQLLALIVLAFTGLAFARRGWHRGEDQVGSFRGKTQNARTKDAARRLVENGYAGMVAAHTHHCELSELGTGFYANTGSCSQVIDRVSARLRLPHVYLPRLQLSWVMLEITNGWTVRLIAARRGVPGASRLERAAAGRAERRLETDPVQVASWPNGPLLPE
ncbi:MAG: metallophosphoesterase [Actinomycetota bacterium]